MTAPAQVIGRNTCHCRQPIVMLAEIGWCHVNASVFVKCDNARPAIPICAVCREPRPIDQAGRVEAHDGADGRRCRGSLAEAATPPEHPW